MIRRPPRSTLSLHDALPISRHHVAFASFTDDVVRGPRCRFARLGMDARAGPALRPDRAGHAAAVPAGAHANTLRVRRDPPRMAMAVAGVARALRPFRLLHGTGHALVHRRVRPAAEHPVREVPDLSR